MTGYKMAHVHSYWINLFLEKEKIHTFLHSHELGFLKTAQSEN